MNYYIQQVQALNKALYANVFLLKQVIQAKYFIDNNFTDTITLNDVCRHACLSKFHLVRSFKTIYGTTPHQYLTALRIEKAKLLLRKGKPVLTVCFAVGFESATSFTGLFKKSVGLSPIAFKKKQSHKSKNQEVLYLPNNQFCSIT